MSCEDDQSETWGRYEELKDKMSHDDREDFKYLLNRWSELYDSDDSEDGNNPDVDEAMSGCLEEANFILDSYK